MKGQLIVKVVNNMDLIIGNNMVGLLSFIISNIIILGGIIIRVEISIANLKARTENIETHLLIHEQQNREDIERIANKIDEIKNLIIENRC